MKSIRQQIIEAKREKTERESELWFVDYCNNCKTGLAFKNDVHATTHITAGMKENQLLSKQELLELMIFEDYTATSQHRCMLNISN